jgi:predicted  nucleic acid-binding Zn-ribbon protein
LSKKRRKRPGKHTVRPTHSRYNVPSYPRGEGPLATRGSGKTLIHAPIKYRCTKCGTIFEPSTIEHRQVCPKCKRKSGVPYHGESSKSKVWIDKWEKERENYIKRGKPLSHLEERIVRHKASLILGRNFGEDPEAYKRRMGLTEYYDWKLDTSGQKSDKSQKKVSKTKLRVGERVRVRTGSGLDSGKMGTIVDRQKVKTDGRGIPTNIEGAYKPMRRDEVPVELDNGNLILMFKNRLERTEKVWVNPQDGYWETGDPPKGIKTFEVTPKELHSHNEAQSHEIHRMQREMAY